MLAFALFHACTTGGAETASIIGEWEGCDGRVVEISEGDPGDELETAYTLVGVWLGLGELGNYGFTEGELGYAMNDNGDGTFTGEVKWRTSASDTWWDPNTVTIDGNTWTDDGSDSCSETMTRVGTSDSGGA